MKFGKIAKKNIKFEQQIYLLTTILKLILDFFKIYFDKWNVNFFFFISKKNNINFKSIKSIKN